MSRLGPMDTWRNLSTTQRVSVIAVALLMVMAAVDYDLTVALGLALGGVAIYFVPSIIGRNRKAPNLGPIFVINLFLGWTLIGWVVALAMAVRDVPQDAEKPLDP